MSEITLSQQMLADGVPAGKNSVFGKAMRSKPVGYSADFERIKALPRRRLEVRGEPPDDWAYFVYPDGSEFKIPDITPFFARNPRKPTMRLWALQNAALWELSHVGGLFAPITVGGGKTLILLLAHAAMFHEHSTARTMLFTKPELRDQLMERDIPYYDQHFRLLPRRVWNGQRGEWVLDKGLLRDRVRLHAYSELSVASGSTLIEDFKPDLLVFDEFHAVRSRSSSRTRRVNRYMARFQETRVAGMTGTAMKDSLNDFEHLMAYCLKPHKSPLPHNFGVLEEWSMAIDVPRGDAERKDPGVLREFCKDDKEDVRAALSRRINETPGVIASVEQSVDIPLVISGKRLELPSKVRDLMLELNTSWKLGNSEYNDAMHVARVARELSCGFYYEWEWPKGEIDKEWLFARRAWGSAVRRFLTATNRPGLDSEFLVARAVKAGALKGSKWGAELAETYAKWVELRDDRTKKHGKAVVDGKRLKHWQPPTVSRWVDNFLVADVVRWGRERIARGENGIIFYEFNTVGEVLAKIGGWPMFGQGTDAGTTNAKANPVIVCSITAQGTGKNLQTYNQMLVVTPPSSGITWEQMIGREHRPGQKAKAVQVSVYNHTEVYQRALDKAFSHAVFIETLQQTKQKLNAAELHNLERRINTEFTENDIEIDEDEDTDENED